MRMKLIKYQPKDKVIKSVKLEYSNGTHSHFTLNAWKGKNNFINIDDKVISRRNEVESVIKDRPLFYSIIKQFGCCKYSIAFITVCRRWY